MKFFIVSLAVAFGWTLPGCNTSYDYDNNQHKKDFVLAEFKSLEWLEGNWTGSGGKNPFYEIYSFINDSTIEINYFGPDSTFSNSLGKGSVFFDNGGIYHEYYEGGIWGATEIVENSIKFIPIKNATTIFSWDFKSRKVWTATLKYRDSNGKLVESKYTMTEN